jgi:H+/Cl- antiporter ClcA
MKEKNKVGVWLIFGVGIGGGIGATFHNMILGASLGAAIGIIIWSILPKQHTKEEDIKKE